MSANVWTVGTNATVYHTDADCCRLQRDEVKSYEVSKDQAERRGLTLCAVCAGEWTSDHNCGGGISELERILREQEDKL